MFVSMGSVVVVDGDNMFDNNVAGIKGGEERPKEAYISQDIALHTAYIN